MKLINNYISAVVNLATAEGLALGLKAGLAQEVMVEVISQTPAGQGHIRTTWPEKALKDNPEPAFMPPPIHHRLNLGCGLVNRCTPIRSGRARERILSVPLLEY
jgi:4-hydroxybutyrate dehydrogenase / sulfolactaldehyde 3-reductase